MRRSSRCSSAFLADHDPSPSRQPRSFRALLELETSARHPLTPTVSRLVGATDTAFIRHRPLLAPRRRRGAEHCGRRDPRSAANSVRLPPGGYEFGPDPCGAAPISGGRFCDAAVELACPSAATTPERAARHFRRGRVPRAGPHAERPLTPADQRCSTSQALRARPTSRSRHHYRSRRQPVELIAANHRGAGSSRLSDRHHVVDGASQAAKERRSV